MKSLQSIVKRELKIWLYTTLTQMTESGFEGEDGQIRFSRVTLNWKLFSRNRRRRGGDIDLAERDQNWWQQGVAEKSGQITVRLRTLKKAVCQCSLQDPQFKRKFWKDEVDLNFLGKTSFKETSMRTEANYPSFNNLFWRLLYSKRSPISHLKRQVLPPCVLSVLITA